MMDILDGETKVFYATLPMGLERVSAREIEGFGGRIRELREGKGRVFFEGRMDLVPILNNLSRTLERVMLLLCNTHVSSLDDVYRAVKSLDFSFINPDQSFAIRSSRTGTHDFTSIDISREAGQGVIDSYLKDRKIRLKVDLDDPDIIIRVDLIQDELFVGIDTTGDRALHKRWYRVYNHPAPLNPSIACSMIYLSGWKKEKTLLDPMCGSGTIPIESAMMIRNIPPGKNRDFSYFEFLGRILPEFRESGDSSIILGSDRFRKHVEGAKENAKEAGVLDTVRFFQMDVKELKGIEAEYIVTNPPYGLRIGRKGRIKELYEILFERSMDVLTGDSILTLITPYGDLIKDLSIAFGFQIKEEMKVRYGDLDTTIFKLKA